MKVSEVSEIVTEKVLEALDRGVVPWHMSWSSGLPVSMSTGKYYRGINTLLLGMAGFASPWWGTYDKIAELSGMVKVDRPKGKGHYWVAPADDPLRRILKENQRATKVYYWEVKRTPDRDDPGNRDADRIWMFATVHSVFNAEQAASLPEKYYSAERVPQQDMPEAAAIWDRYLTSGGPAVRYEGTRAYYEGVLSDGMDRITLPPKEIFDSADAFWSTAFHEAGHSTGHVKRLKREGVEHFDHFGSEKYSREELVAEMTALTICAMLGIESTFDNSASYIDHWMRKIRSDDGRGMVVTASRQAAKAVDLILGVTYDNQESG